MQKLWLLLLSVLVGVWGCKRSEVLPLAPTATTNTFLQWAVAAEATSQFGYPDWSVTRILGAPDVSGCVDDPRAWASARGNGVESVRLTYARPVYATEVQVYQTWGRGALARISLVDEAGNVVIVWESTDTVEPCPGVLAVVMPRTSYRVVEVRIDLDESRTGFWNQIDAVALIGVPSS